MHSPAVLLILDGYGEGPVCPGNAVCRADTPALKSIFNASPHCLLTASGADVGLPEGQFGNSEVGHTNLGAGRVVYQDLSRIDRAIEDGSFFENPALGSAMARGRVHIMGLVSDGGVHTVMRHIEALIDMAKREGARLYLHAFTDGRDTPPASGLSCLRQLADKAEIATVSGRYFAMDRDSRWDRVEAAYRALTTPGAGGDPVAYLEECYQNGVTDEFVPPKAFSPEGYIRDGDGVIFINFRPDRARQLTRAFLDPEFSRFAREKLTLTYVCMTQYDADFAPWAGVAFPPHALKNTLGEWVSHLGLRQLRCAETEKYAHVTFFFNGGREKPFEGEKRILVPSPKVATYDLAPQMSALEVADKVVRALALGLFDLVIVNLANPDMVGHTGVIDAVLTALRVVDIAADRIVTAAKKAGGFAIVTADHGNAESMLLEDNTPQTAHSAYPVPFAVVGRGEMTLKDGRLCDVAPTLLTLMGLPIPPEMEGVDLSGGTAGET
ncbi:MAG TPA: 2,3-bisphosphoglycerate-independent phosphoglycerate mutase [Terriglobales bacterium]|nr:2,3-bisphosphoglycerate-independent phosphoglycerate mutase [Terriglobales bacterium]